MFPTNRTLELELYRHIGVIFSDEGNNYIQSAIESFSQNNFFPPLV